MMSRHECGTHGRRFLAVRSCSLATGNPSSDPTLFRLGSGERSARDRLDDALPIPSSIIIVSHTVAVPCSCVPVSVASVVDLSFLRVDGTQKTPFPSAAITSFVVH